MKVNRELFGVEDLYKGSIEQEESYTQEEIKKAFLEGDDKIGNIELKFYSDQEITDQELEEADIILNKVSKIITLEMKKYEDSVKDQMESMPTPLVHMVLHSAIGNIIQMGSTLGYKKAVMNIIRKKLNRKRSSENEEKGE